MAGFILTVTGMPWERMITAYHTVRPMACLFSALSHHDAPFAFIPDMALRMSPHTPTLILLNFQTVRIFLKMV